MEFKLINTNNNKELKKITVRNTNIKINFGQDNIWINKKENNGYNVLFTIGKLFKECILKDFETLEKFISEIKKTNDISSLVEVIKKDYLKNSDKMKFVFDLNTSFGLEVERIIINYMDCKLVYNVCDKKVAEVKKESSKDNYNNDQFLELRDKKFSSFEELYKYLKSTFIIKETTHYVSDVIAGHLGKINNLKVKDIESVYKLVNTLKEVFAK